MKLIISLLFLTQFISCFKYSRVDIHLNKNLGESQVLGVSINQAVTESVGACSFMGTSDPSSSAGFSYRVLFSKAVDPGTFTIGDITNVGTGGGATLTWTLTNCGDDTNYMLTAATITGYGTIIPTIAASTVQDLDGKNNEASTSTDASVTYIAAISWNPVAYIKAANNDASDSFGHRLSISGDTLAVGVPTEDSNQTTITNGSTASSDNSSDSSGAVYVYKRTGGNWGQEAYIKAVNNDAFDYFGINVSLFGDTLAVGSYLESSTQTTITNGATASNDDSKVLAGAVYVYKRTGVNWAQEAYIKASNSGVGDQFGFSLKVFGNTLVVGALAESSNQTTITNGTTSSGDNSNASSGAVYVYKRTGVNWAQEAYIKASNNGTSDTFGINVGLSEDTLVVGATGEDSNQSTITNGTTASGDNSNAGSGAVYVYKRTGVIWAQEAYIKASNNDATDTFGTSLSLSGDTLVVGATSEDSNQTTITNGSTASGDNSNADSGAVYVYKRTGVTWAQEAYIKAPNNDAGDGFGFSVGLSGDTLVVGAPAEDSNQTSITNGATGSGNNSNLESGAVYVYQNINRLFDVSDLFGTADSSSVTLSWNKSGGTATGYYVSYKTGPTPPVDCSSDTVINVMDVNTHTEPALSAATTYSFRVCATDGVSFSPGTTFSITTDP